MNRRIVSVPDSLSSRSIPGRKPDLRFSPGAWVIADNASFFAVASSRKLPPPLLYASTDHSADVRYFGHATVPDAFIAFGRGKKKYAVVSALEFGRIRRESAFDVVLPLEAWVAKARARWPRRSVGVADVICLLAAELGQTRFTVPQDFPAGLYAKLRRLGLDVTVAPGGATMVEFKVDYPGKYALVDHALSRATKGLIGILEVEGKPDDSIIKDKTGDSRKQMGEMQH